MMKELLYTHAGLDTSAKVLLIWRTAEEMEESKRRRDSGMRKIKHFFDLLDYILVRLFLLAMLIFGAVMVVMQHWPWHH